MSKPQSDHVGFVVDKVAPEQVFSEYFSFQCQSFHQLFHTYDHLSYNGHCTKWTQSQPNPTQEEEKTNAKETGVYNGQWE
jgi:hypothetical protein